MNVDIEIPAAACVQPRELVAPSDFLMAHGIDTQENCESIINHIFSIDETVSFKSYEDSCVKTESGPRIPPMLIGPSTNPLYGTRYLESTDFDDLIDFRFGEYKFIPNAKEHTVLVRLSFDRLQQCRSYAFPTKILVRNAELACIRYWITADVSIAASSGGDSAMRQCANPLAIGARLRRQSGWESFCSQPFFELSVARLPRSSR